MEPGLHKLIWTKRAQATESALRARNPRTDPRIAYECAVAAERLAKEADAHAEHAYQNEELVELLEKQIDFLTQSPHGSRHRTLVIRHLEDASMRLLRENGDMPEDPT